MQIKNNSSLFFKIKLYLQKYYMVSDQLVIWVDIDRSGVFVY